MMSLPANQIALHYKSKHMTAIIELQVFEA